MLDQHPAGLGTDAPLRLQVRNLQFYYGKLHALHNINLQVAANRVTALIGPSGCGKSTLIRTLNRMHEAIRNTRIEGEILLDGENIFTEDVTRLRRRIGMVFQRPCGSPKLCPTAISTGYRVAVHRRNAIAPSDGRRHSAIRRRNPASHPHSS